MFNSRRFTAEPSQDYSFVTIQQPACKPAKVMYSEIGGGSVYVNCIPILGKDGKPNTKEMLSFRSQNKASLRAAIEKEYQASFSSTGEADVTEAAKAALAAVRQQVQMERPVTEEEKRSSLFRLSRAFGNEPITLNKCIAQGISERVFNALLKQEQAKYIDMVTASHRELVNDLSPKEQEELTQANISNFVRNTEWASWFKQYEGNFLGYCDYTNANYKTLVRVCEAMGFYCPINLELDKAMRYCLNHGHFYLRPTYPRTLRDEYRRVKPFTGVIEPEIVPVDEREQALANMKDLNSHQLKQAMAATRTAGLSEDERKRRGRIVY